MMPVKAFKKSSIKPKPFKFEEGASSLTPTLSS